MIHLLFPWALALAVPALIAERALAPRDGGWWWRWLLIAVIAVAASGPEWSVGRGGSDVVLVVDRSTSVGALRAQQPLQVQVAADARGGHDRLTVIAFGEHSAIALAPSGAGSSAQAVLASEGVGEDGSELASALEAAASLLPPGRSGRVVVLSDGEATGADPLPAAARLAARSIMVDVLGVVRPPMADAAVAAIELPGTLRLGESFLGALVVVGDRSERRTWRVLRNGKEVATGAVELSPLRAVSVSFADRPVTPGLVRYRVELDATDDRQPANNVAETVARIDPGERVLVISGDGTPGNVAKALTAAGMTVASRGEGPLNLADLVGCSVLVLDEVPASKLGRAGQEQVARWVEQLGGGLVVTGGRRSFGAGGYHKSPIERVLPVTMEIRDEHRKTAVAMVMALDRSGSMSVTVDGGRTKMDLADEGAAAAVELLGPKDHVAVFAVDTAAHYIVPLTQVGPERASIIDRIIHIGSEGGGIYIAAAILAAGVEVAKAPYGTRHIVVFADANDSEEPGDYPTYLKTLRDAGVTVSVVAMGSENDVHANLLKDVAERGGGRISFAESAEDIPRLFAQETVLISRSSWVQSPAAILGRPAAQALLGAGAPAAWPGIPGYNLCYPRDRVQVLAWLQGDPEGPAIAAWNCGAGKSVAVCFDLDDKESATLLAWDGYAGTIAGLVRWASAAGDDAPGGLTARRSGRTVELDLALDPERGVPAAAPTALVAYDGAAAPAFPVELHQVDAHRWSGSFQLADRRVALPVANVLMTAGGHPAAILTAPVMVLMSPEAAPRHGLPGGERLLADLARVGGGTVRKDLIGIFSNPPSPGRVIALAPWLVAAAVLLLVAEIAIRRLRLTLAIPRLAWPRAFAWLRLPGRSARAAAPATPATGSPEAPAGPTAPAADPEASGIADALGELRRRRNR